MAGDAVPSFQAKRGIHNAFGSSLHFASLRMKDRRFVHWACWKEAIRAKLALRSRADIFQVLQKSLRQFDFVPLQRLKTSLRRD